MTSYKLIWVTPQGYVHYAEAPFWRRMMAIRCGVQKWYRANLDCRVPMKVFAVKESER